MLIEKIVTPLLCGQVAPVDLPGGYSDPAVDGRIIDGRVEEHGAHLEDGADVFRGEMALGREKVFHVLARELRQGTYHPRCIWPCAHPGD